MAKVITPPLKKPVVASAPAVPPAKPVKVKPAPTPAAAAPAEVTEPKAPAARSPNSATAEEIDAAIAGNLEARPVVGTADQENLTKVSTAGKPVGRPLGTTTGLPIMLAFCYLFQQNEKAPAADKFSDEEISAWMKNEFPGRETAVFDKIPYARRIYNTGGATKGTAPKLQSNRFGEGGVILPARGRTKKAEAPAAAAAAPAPAKAPVKGAAAVPVKAPPRKAAAPIKA